MRRPFLAIITPLLCLYWGISAEGSVDERSEIKREMTELRVEMEAMQRRLERLEERYRALEEEGQRAGEEREREEALEETPSPGITGGVGRLIQSLNPDISVIGTFAGVFFTKDDTTALAESDPEDTGVDIQEIEIAFSGAVDPFFRFDSFFSLQEEDIETEEAYATTLFSLPLGLQFRTGIMRSKFGRINTRHRHFQDFATLALPASRFLGEHLNPTGIELSALPPLPWFVELSASVNSPEVETPSFDRDEDGNDVGKLLYIFHIANFFELSEDLSLSLGGSFATGANGTEEGNRTNLFGADLFAKYRPLRGTPYRELRLQSEFMYRDAEAAEADLEDWGFYSQLVYRFAKRWMGGVRVDFVDTDDPINTAVGNESAAEGSLFSFSRSAEEEEEGGGLGLFGQELRYAFMLTFSPTEFSRLRLQYEFTDPDFKDDFQAVFLQLQYSLGAHGAHPY